ncbi:hypothetical protein STENM223S_05419 [Streptomyces tendae]
MNIDVSQKLNDALVPYLVLVVGLAFLLLIVVFRSILVPLKAALGFLLSVMAALGAVVAVFQWGWLSGLMGVEETGPVMSMMPIFMVGVVFGLAMDYEVFLVTRMREAFVHGEKPHQAVVTGFKHGAPPHRSRPSGRAISSRDPPSSAPRPARPRRARGARRAAAAVRQRVVAVVGARLPDGGLRGDGGGAPQRVEGLLGGERPVQDRQPGPVVQQVPDQHPLLAPRLELRPVPPTGASRSARGWCSSSGTAAATPLVAERTTWAVPRRHGSVPSVRRRRGRRPTGRRPCARPGRRRRRHPARPAR